MKRRGAVAILAFSTLFAQAAPFMIIGNDEKLVYDEAGKIVLSPAGKDSVSQSSISPIRKTPKSSRTLRSKIPSPGRP
jgi:hypothetical protein